MRIIAGTHRGRNLVAPPGSATRPTADRVRQALFDMLMHAPWAGRALLEGASILDGFAGTGALGLEAFSRGAGTVTFIEHDSRALEALRTNIIACNAHAASMILPIDILRAPPGTAQTLVFLDPPYAQDLVPRAVTVLRKTGWIAPGTLLVAELASYENINLSTPILAQRVHGAAQILIWQEA